MEVIIKKSSMARSMNRREQQTSPLQVCGEMDIAAMDLYESALVAAYDSWSGAGSVTSVSSQSATMSVVGIRRR
jgi:hypothetical protein